MTWKQRQARHRRAIYLRTFNQLERLWFGTKAQYRAARQEEMAEMFEELTLGLGGNRG